MNEIKIIKSTKLVSAKAGFPEIIQRLKRQGKAIVYIPHFIEEVNRIADRVTILRDGREVETSEVIDLTTDKIIASMVGSGLLAGRSCWCRCH
ncbi:MAG: hypothetical protein ACYS1A_15790 [Planctomycetota bacterium]|jgi:ribose transport system ATP-binding protein